MRNLRLLDSLRVADAVELSGTQQICVDYDTKVVYCATSTGLYGLEPKTQEVVCQVSLVEAGYLPEDGSGVVVGVEHIPDQMSVCVATQTGDVIMWNTTNNQLECVGSVEHGLMTMSWSTDQELVVLATGQQTLIMMTREFDPVTEVSMFSGEFGEAVFVNVGWGKKETQFHGSEGKQAATVKKPKTVECAQSWDDRQTRICWHGDGQYFVVSAIRPDTGCRNLRVWTRECTLHSTGEIVDGLEQALGWKSTGNLITTSQRRPNRHDIVFFERNGLQHGEFTLPFSVKEVKVKEVYWNRESTILAIWLEDLPADDDPSYSPHSYVQLWTVSNYHWYLKQSLKYPATAGDRVAALFWDQELANRLHVVCRSGQYTQYTWGWVTDTSCGVDERDRAIVAVIDGDKVLMTPARQMLVPPPMSAYQLQLPVPVSQVIFSPASPHNELAVLTNDNKISLFTFEKDVKPVEGTCIKIGAAGGNGFTIRCNVPVLRGVYSFEDITDSEYPLKYYHITWYKPDVMLLCMLNIMGSETEIYSANFDHKSTTLKLSAGCSVDGYIYTTAVSSETGTVVMELTDGRILQYHPDSHTVSPWLTESGEQVIYSAPRLCTSIDVCTIGEQEVVIGLTAQYQFYVNNIQVASNCTSYGIHDEFLLLTTYAHTCRCIARKTNVNVLASLSDGKSHPFDESIRRIERGSRIVTVIPGDTKIILQMPRGNLETVHPRALVLCAVRKHLDGLEFQKAFVLMRKHRINMNLIHDNNPKGFLDNVDQFIHQVEAPSHINQFLTDLQEEDVTKTMYTATYHEQTAKSSSATEAAKSSKIDAVCDVIRRALERIDPDKYLLSILTAYVRKSTPELDVALKTVRDLKGGSSDSSISAEEALKYLLFLVDVNELYDVALGTYDFQLVLMVAEKSQKDPKEYIPFLNSLRKMETNYQKYTIDVHLKRYTSALQNIVKCGDDYFEECLKLVKDQRLYREAMALYPHTTQQYKDIACAYGSFLLNKNHQEEAGLIFSKAEAWTSAIEAYEQALCWRLALCMAYRAGYDQAEMEGLCTRLVRGLTDSSRHSEAACILEQHLNDLEEAIVTLIEGCQWEEALRLMHKSSRQDFIETHMKSALLENHSQYVNLLTSVYAEFEKHKNRLAIIREQKEKARLEFLEGGFDHNAADADLFSDTSSATGESAISATDSNRSTIFSKRSGRSAKTRRKQERKKWSLKEGSTYEDIALIEALSKSCKQTEEWRGDVSGLLRTLSLFHHEAEALELQKLFDNLLTLVEKSIPLIWPEESDEPENMLPNLGPDSTANAIAQAMQQGTKIRPEIKIEASLRTAPVLSKDNKWKLHSSDR